MGSDDAAGTITGRTASAPRRDAKLGERRAAANVAPELAEPAAGEVVARTPRVIGLERADEPHAGRGVVGDAVVSREIVAVELLDQRVDLRARRLEPDVLRRLRVAGDRVRVVDQLELPPAERRA